MTRKGIGGFAGLPQFIRGKVDEGKLKESTTVGLTSLGATKAESIYGAEGPKGAILLMLKSAGPSTINEIAEETGISTDRVKMFVKDMIVHSKYVRRVTGE